MTTGRRIPVLWLCGPSGVGKSTVSWQLYTELAGAGVRVAFADGDQLGMCYPAPPGDPEGLRVKALNFRAMLGLTAGYVDLRQIGFLRPARDSDPGNQSLKAGNLADIWRNYQAAGATQLIVAGSIDEQADLPLYTETVTAAGLTLVRLRAGRQELSRRVMSRGTGGSWQAMTGLRRG